MKEYGNKNEGQRRLDYGIRKNDEGKRFEIKSLLFNILNI